MTKIIVSTLAWLLMPIAAFVIAFDVAKCYIESKIDKD